MNNNIPFLFKLLIEYLVKFKYNLLSPVAFWASYGGLPITASNPSIFHFSLISNSNVLPSL